MRPTKIYEEAITDTRSAHQEMFKVLETGHYKNKYRNPRADFDADYEGDVVVVEDLLGGTT